MTTSDCTDVASDICQALRYGGDELENYTGNAELGKRHTEELLGLAGAGRGGAVQVGTR